MSNKRFEKLAARERAMKAQQKAAAIHEEKARITGQGTVLKLMAATAAALLVIGGLLVVTLTFGGEEPLRDRVRGAIYSGLGLDAASKNPDILAFAPAPDGWRRQEYAGIRDGRLARGVVELAMLRIAEDPGSRDEIIADLVERVRENRLDDLTDAEQEVLGGPDAVAAGRALRQFRGDMAVAAYTDGAEVFTLQIIRSGGGGRAAAFSLTNIDKARVLVAGMEFDDGTQSVGGGPNPLSEVGGAIILSRKLSDNAYLYIVGIGSVSTAAMLIDASDFELISGEQEQE